MGCLLLGLASLVAGLGWVAEWRANLATLVAHPAPLFTLAGCWIALVVVRWRSRDARLVLAFAAVPQLLFFADQLPLLLVARDRRELAFLVLAGWAVAVPWLEAATPGLHVRLAAPYVLLGVYGPAVYLTLRRA